MVVMLIIRSDEVSPVNRLHEPVVDGIGVGPNDGVGWEGWVGGVRQTWVSVGWYNPSYR